MRAILAATALVAALALVQPAAGQIEDEDEVSPGELTAEAVDRLLRALDLLMGSIPQYEAPYVNENGDIIIRRKHPERDLPTPEHKPAPPETDTTTT
jgi:hypothetical protein